MVQKMCLGGRARVRDSLAAHPDEMLTLAGTPVLAEGRCILLAQTCERVRPQRAQAEADED